MEMNIILYEASKQWQAPYIIQMIEVYCCSIDDKLASSGKLAPFYTKQENQRAVKKL